MSKFDKVGALTKLGAKFKTWNQRIFALSKPRKVLFYFKSIEDCKTHVDTGVQNYQGVINLHNAFVYEADYMDKPFCFEISTPGRNYFIHAASKQERDDWITALAGTGLKFKSPDKMALLTYDGPAQTVPVYVFSKHGYLQKRGAINKSFKTRFCRTTENAAGEKVLAYYKAADELEPQGVVELTGTQVKDPCDDSKAGADPAEFHLVTKNRTWVFRAISKEDKRKWLDVLEACIKGEKEFFASRPTNTNVDLYKIMQVPKDASQDDISAAYKELAKTLHPDRNASATANEEFGKLKEAYEVLRDPQKRAVYDKQRALAIERGEAKQSPPDERKETPAKRDKEPAPAQTAESPRPVIEKNTAHPGQAERDAAAAAAATAAAAPAASPATPAPAGDAAAAAAPAAGEQKVYKQRKPKGTGAAAAAESPAASPAPAAAPAAAAAAAAPVAAAAAAAAATPAAGAGHDRKPSVAATPATAAAPKAEAKVDAKAEPPKAEPKPEAKVEAKPEAKAEAPKPAEAAAAAAAAKPAEAKVEAKAEAKAEVKEVPGTENLPEPVRKAIALLDKGAPMYKLSRGGWGVPKITTFHIKAAPGGAWAIKWDSSKKKNDDETTMVLDKSKVKLCEGQKEGLFYKAKNQKAFATKEDVSFSIVAAKRTLDVVCQSKEDYANMMTVIKHFLA